MVRSLSDDETASLLSDQAAERAAADAADVARQAKLAEAQAVLQANPEIRTVLEAVGLVLGMSLLPESGS